VFKENLLFYREENFEGSLLIDGYYDDKYFAINITDNDFVLLYDDTELTDEELGDIFEYIMSYKN